MCGAPEQTDDMSGVDLKNQIVLAGKVTSSGEPVAGAFVRLLDSTGEFTAAVVSSATGNFRFFASPGSWTVRALSRAGNGQAELSAEGPGLHQAEITVG